MFDIEKLLKQSKIYTLKTKYLFQMEEKPHFSMVDLALIAHAMNFFRNFLLNSGRFV